MVFAQRRLISLQSLSYFACLKVRDEVSKPFEGVAAKSTTLADLDI